jgi:hypothetical protein
MGLLGMVESIVLECWEVAFGVVVVFPCSMDLHPQSLWAMDTFQCMMILPQVLNRIGNSDNGIVLRVSIENNIGN